MASDAPERSIQVRPWRDTDDVAGHIAAIYAEHHLCFDPVYEDDLFDVAGVYGHGAFWVAEDEDGLVATAAVVPDGGARLIRRMYVAPRGRRRGLAARLLAQCEQFGSFARTHLWSDVRFRGAHALYRGAGFTPGHTRVLTDPDRSVERYFWRPSPWPRVGA